MLDVGNFLSEYYVYMPEEICEEKMNFSSFVFPLASLYVKIQK